MDSSLWVTILMAWGRGTLQATQGHGGCPLERREQPGAAGGEGGGRTEGPWFPGEDVIGFSE